MEKIGIPQQVKSDVYLRDLSSRPLNSSDLQKTQSFCLAEWRMRILLLLLSPALLFWLYIRIIHVHANVTHPSVLVFTAQNCAVHKQ